MKATIKLTTEQIDQIVKQEESQIKARHEKELIQLEQQQQKELSSIRKKYESFTIDLGETGEKKTRGKFDEETFIKLYNEKKGPSEIARIMGLTPSYVSIKKKALIGKKKIK